MEAKDKEYFKSQLMNIMTICGQLLNELEDVQMASSESMTDCSVRVDNLLDDSAFDLLANAQAKRRGGIS